MAHLQPNYSSPPASASHKIRLTALRGFVADTVRLDAHQVREIWGKRFREQGPGHPYWLYTHIPFCPQICSFCQCSTGLKKSDREVADYLDWLEGEMDFLSRASESGQVKYQYVGGGTPNLLSDVQLERLLLDLNRRHRFDPNSRRTFEFLPSALRPETLPLVRSLGFNRLSCGVQSWDAETLKSVNRSHAGLEQLGRTIEQAYQLGYDEFNVDLIHGLADERRGRFLSGLLELLRLRPTTVTIHHLIPTTTNPVYASVGEELDAHLRFEQLQSRIGDAVAHQFPQMEWVLRPNSWIVVDRQFRNGPGFSYWYYSDNERIHIDMLSVGRFAHSNILGQVFYENLSRARAFDPHEASYEAFVKTPTIDAALDLITDLVGDRGADLAPIRERYGAKAVERFTPVLEQLEHEGHVVTRHGRWEPVHTDGVFVDPFLPLLEAAMDGRPRPWVVALGKDAERGVAIGAGERSLLVFVEKISPEKRYFTEIGKLGIYYRNLNETQAGEQGTWVEELMAAVLEQLRQLVEHTPHISPKEVTAQLKRRLAQSQPQDTSRV